MNLGAIRFNFSIAPKLLDIINDHITGLTDV